MLGYPDEILFSKKRLQSYVSEAKHLDNFRLIKEIAPRVLLIEVMLRNLIDFLMGAQNWLDSFPNPYILTEIQSIKSDYQKCRKTSPSHDQIISSLNFGAWAATLADPHYQQKTQNQILVDLQQIHFMQYLKKQNSNHMSAYTEQRAIFEMVKKIRNRAFHAENVLQKEIQVKFGCFKFSLCGWEIVEFLDDAIRGFGLQSEEIWNAENQNLCGSI